eukprot:689764-Pleurochrysis_carterae.AAC.1
MIACIIPEWQDRGNKRRKGAISLLRIWTGESMNTARAQMKMWIAIKMNIKPQYNEDGTTGE